MGESSNGHLKWHDWFFDYGVFGDEGLSLVDGYFRGQRMFNKFSLPVIRVKYVVDEFWGGLSSTLGVGCGPYNDKITWDTEQFGEDLNPVAGPHHLVEMSCGGSNRYLCIEELAGTPARLRLSVYARIGAYHVFQSWTLDDDGWVSPRVFSKGLSCNLDHWHHPYWRFDFALGEPQTHRLEVFEHGGGKVADVTVEGGLVGTTFARRAEYHVTSTDAHPGAGTVERPAQAVVVSPQVDAGTGVVGPTPFAPLDGYVRVYRPEEDRSWPHEVDRDMTFDEHRSCVDEDIVLWSICHLSHHAGEGKDHWHSVGPDVFLRPMILAAVPPECLRVLDLVAELHVKDFKAVGKDLWEHRTFTEQVLVDPSAPTAEAVLTLDSGDVTGSLVLRCTWNPDSSVSVHFTADLHDELERVARVEGDLLVGRDATGQWNGIHLVDHHGGDPDTADIAFEVANNQR